MSHSNSISADMDWVAACMWQQLANIDSLVDILTGIVADKTVNCDTAYDIGLVAASVVVGKNFTDVKLSRKDRVTTFT